MIDCFYYNLHNFIFCVTGAQDSLENKITLTPCETYDLSTIRTPHDCQAVANSTEALQAIEDCMQVWIKQIEQVCMIPCSEN